MTLQDTPEPILLTPPNAEILQDNCLRCHADHVHDIAAAGALRCVSWRDYRDRRGHAYLLEDQENTERRSKPQSGSCLHCHASVMPLYRQLGNGDAIAGVETTYTTTYAETNKLRHDSGNAHRVSCVDCHDPDSMGLRVTRRGSPGHPGARGGRRHTTRTTTPPAPRCARSSAGSATSSTTAPPR